MTETDILARILGGYMLIMGLGMLVHRQMASDLMERLRTDFSLTFMMGMMALFVGLVIVSIHNVWSSPSAALISLIGWLAVLEGAAITLLRERYIALMEPMMRPPWAGTAWAILSLVLGIWLLWVGLDF